jgi:hypothetical protein
MANILIGKEKGKKVKISQWCNDWISVKENNKIYRITQLSFTQTELKTIKSHKDNGFMFEVFEIVGDRFRFKKSK